MPRALDIGIMTFSVNICIWTSESACYFCTSSLLSTSFSYVNRYKRVQSFEEILNFRDSFRKLWTKVVCMQSSSAIKCCRCEDQPFVILCWRMFWNIRYVEYELESAEARGQLYENECDSLPTMMESGKQGFGRTKPGSTRVVPLHFFLLIR